MAYRKKQLEQRVIEQFISHESLKLRVSAVNASETPDFIIKSLRENYSVELTRLVNPEIKAIEVLQERIVEGAKELFVQKYKEKMRVWVTFNDVPIKCKKGQEDIYSKEIFEFVENVYLTNKDFKFRAKSKRNSPPLPYIEEMYIGNETGICNWQPFEGFIVTRPDFKIIDEAIRSKEKGLQKYHQDYKENWLVIAANFGKQSTALDFMFIETYKATTNFDKVFIYNFRSDEVIPIRIQKEEMVI